MKKKSILILVLLLAVGFAAVSTTLLINGTTKIGVDESFDDDVIFTRAEMDDPSTKTKDDNEKGGEAEIQEGSKTIILATGNLTSLGNTSTLTYEITNQNLNYDAQAEIECAADPATATDRAAGRTVGKYFRRNQLCEPKFKLADIVKRADKKQIK